MSTYKKEFGTAVQNFAGDYTGAVEGQLWYNSTAGSFQFRALTTAGAWTTGGEYVGLQAPTSVSASYTLTFPAATGSADQILVTDGSGNLSFVDNSGGTSWQAVKTTAFTAVAGEGYFINTTSGAITMTLPASPTLGDEVSFIDYAGTFDTNNLTIGRNSENIQGSAADLTVSVERAANTLVYTDGTQGWLLKVK